MLTTLPFVEGRDRSDERRSPGPAATRPLGLRTRKRSARGARTAGWIAPIAIALLASLAFLPSASAAKFNPVGLHAAPFRGTLHSGQVIVASGCGAHAGFTTAPKFNLSTGIGHLAEKSTATGCGPKGFPDFGSVLGITGFDSPTFVWSRAAPLNFTVNLTTVLVANLSATPMNPAGGPFAWASYLTLSKGVLWDLTTSTVANSFTIIIGDTTNLSANATVNQASNFTGFAVGFLPGNLTNGHSYIVQMYIEVWAFAYAPSATATHASARVTLAGSTGEYRANSWKIG